MSLAANPANTYQSPINFDTAGSFAPSGDSLTINYPESIEAAVANNGHGSPQIFFKPGATVTFNGETYNLLQVHFHSPSEETFDGTAPAFDAHFVHQNPETKDLLVIGQLYNAGSKGAPLLQTALDNVPAGNGTEQADIADGVVLAANIPSNAVGIDPSDDDDDDDDDNARSLTTSLAHSRFAPPPLPGILHLCRLVDHPPVLGRSPVVRQQGHPVRFRRPDRCSPEVRRGGRWPRQWKRPPDPAPQRP